MRGPIAARPEAAQGALDAGPRHFRASSFTINRVSRNLRHSDSFIHTQRFYLGHLASTRPELCRGGDLRGQRK